MLIFSKLKLDAAALR